jgi:hypothetical protein
MMNRDVLGRQMFAKGGVARQRITDPYIIETIQNLQNAMRQGNAATAAYVQENFRDLQDIAAVYPQVAPIINQGIDVLRSQTAPSLRQPMAPEMGKSLGDLMTPAPDGSMDYYAPGPFGYENAPEAPVMPQGPSDKDVDMFREDFRRYQENERGDQMLVPQPPPGVIEEMPSPAPGIPMAMGGVATPRDPYVDPGKRTRVLPAQDFRDPYVDPGKRTRVLPAQDFRDPYVDPGKRTQVLPAQDFRDPYVDPGKRTQVLPSMSTMLLNNFRQEFKREPRDISELRAYAENLGSGAQARMALGGEPMAAAMGQMGGDPMAGMMGGDPMAAMGAPMPPMGAPMPADQGPVMDEGIASQLPPEVMQILGAAARSFGDPEKAESFEEMMNMIRGVPASEEERRMELAGVVGEQDAQQTPESVLTLVQPVMLLMGAEEGGGAPVDQGIGSVAQEAMNIPVEGPMAEGIMSMAGEGASPPANFNRGGEVRRFENGGGVTYDVNPPYTTVEPISFPLLSGGPEDAQTINAAQYIDAAANLSQLPVRAPAKAASAAKEPAFSQRFKERRDLYRSVLGDTSAADRDMAQAQFFQDLAKFGFGVMQPGKPGENVLAQAGRVALETGLGQNTLALLAKQRAEAQGASRAVDMAALAAAEKAALQEEELASNVAAKAAAKAAAAPAMFMVEWTDASGKPQSRTFNMADPEQATRFSELQKFADGQKIPLSVYKVGEKKEDKPVLVKGLPLDIWNGLTKKQQAIVAGFGPNIQLVERVNPNGSTTFVAYDKNTGVFTPTDIVSKAPTEDVKVLPDGEIVAISRNEKGELEERTLRDTGEADPVYKVVEGKGLVRILNPRDPNSDVEVVLEAKEGEKFKAATLILPQGAAAKYGNGRTNVTVRVGQDGNLYLPKQTTPLDLSSPDLAGAYISGAESTATVVAASMARDSNAMFADMTEKAMNKGRETGKFNLFGQVAQDMATAGAIKAEGLRSFDVQNGELIAKLLDKKEAAAMAQAVEMGTGFWPTTRVLLSKILSPVGVLRAEEENAAKNTLMHLKVLARDAFVANSKYPVAEMALVGKLFPDPDTFFTNRQTELIKLKQLRDKLVFNVDIANATLRSDVATGKEQAEARAAIIKSVRVLNLLGDLGETGVSQADQDKAADELIKKTIKRTTPPRDEGN